MFYWIFKWSLFVPVVRLVWRPKVTGRENIPESGPAIVVGNHTSAVETFIVPAMIPRRLTFPAKAELFTRGWRSGPTASRPGSSRRSARCRWTALAGEPARAAWTASCTC